MNANLLLNPGMFRALASALIAASVAGPSFAQDVVFPQEGKSVEITVLFPAGTSADVTARLLAEGMARHLGAAIVVVNRPGAAGAIGYRHVAAQKPDGYALVWNSNSISTAFHSGQLAFDYHAFDPVARVLVESPIVVVRGDSKWQTLSDLIAEAKSRPGAVTVGNSGVGSHTHISSVALFKAAAVTVIDVPYAATQVVPSLLGGHVDALVQLPGALASHTKSGAVRVLAALIPNRDPALPGVPTAKEQGIDVVLEAWRGIAVPKGVPKAVIAILEGAIRKTVEAPEFSKASDRLGIRPAFATAAEFGAIIAREDAELERVMRAIGLTKQQ
ncbi:MAG: tripartite tricarboxylate transporter substrate binding protein [Burkholderiales bacterium]